MNQLSAVRSVLAKAYVSDGGEDYWLNGEPAEIQIERTDNDEIRVGTHIHNETYEAAGIYLKRSEAIRMILALAHAVGDR